MRFAPPQGYSSSCQVFVRQGDEEIAQFNVNKTQMMALIHSDTIKVDNLSYSVREKTFETSPNSLIVTVLPGKSVGLTLSQLEVT